MTQQLVTSLLSLVLAWTLLRVYSLARSDIWIWQHGSEFRLEREKLPPSSQRKREVQWQLYDKHRANFFPFGDKSYRIQRFSYGGNSVGAKLVRRPFRVLRYAWFWPGFVVISYILLIVVSQWPTQARFTATQRDLTVATCVTLIVGTVLVGAEGVLATRLMDSTWAVQYQRFNPDPKVPEKAALAETAGFIATALLAWLAAAGTLYFLASRDQGFAKINLGQGIVLRIVTALHYAWTTLIMFTDADPTNTTSTLIVYLLEFQGGAFVLVVFAHIGAAVSPPHRENEGATSTAVGTGTPALVTPRWPQRLTRLFGPGVLLLLGLLWRVIAHRG